MLREIFLRFINTCFDHVDCIVKHLSQCWTWLNPTIAVKAFCNVLSQCCTHCSVKSQIPSALTPNGFVDYRHIAFLHQYMFIKIKFTSEIRYWLKWLFLNDPHFLNQEIHFAIFRKVLLTKSNYFSSQCSHTVTWY
jgi:hypothetical protein